MDTCYLLVLVVTDILLFPLGFYLGWVFGNPYAFGSFENECLLSSAEREK